MQKNLYCKENNTKYMRMLNLTSPLTEKQIKSAYRQFVKSNHPDLFTLDENKKLATAKFKIATEAYEYLIKYWKNINSPNTQNNDGFETFISSIDNFVNSLKKKY